MNDDLWTYVLNILRPISICMYIINYMSSKLSNCSFNDMNTNCCNIEQISDDNVLTNAHNIIYISNVTNTSYLNVKHICDDFAVFNAFDVVDIDAVMIKNKCTFNGKFADTFMDDECDDVGLDIDILVDHSMMLKCKNITTLEYCNYMHDNIICRPFKKKKMFVD